MKISRNIIVLILVNLLCGCSMVTPLYTSAQRNSSQLEEINARIQVGTFESIPNPMNFNPIYMRAGIIHSPYQDSYARYLQEALKMELIEAKKFDLHSNTEISGFLMKNDIQIPAFDMGKGIIEARFVVKKEGQELYNKILLIDHSFESAFSGSVAYSKGIIEYKYMVQKLLNKLLSDPDFVGCFKK